jgi:hypothetical protein
MRKSPACSPWRTNLAFFLALTFRVDDSSTARLLSFRVASLIGAREANDHAVVEQADADLPLARVKVLPFDLKTSPYERPPVANGRIAEIWPDLCIRIPRLVSHSSPHPEPH